MTVFGATTLTLPELAQRQGAMDAMRREMVNPLTQANPINGHGPQRPTTHTLTNEATVVTALPTITRGDIGDAYVGSRSTTAPRVDTCARYMALCTVEASRLDLCADNAGRRRLIRDEANTFWVAMGNQAESDTINGDSSVSPKQYDGFRVRRNALSDYCLDAGGSSNLTSIYFVDWGDGCFFIHPRNVMAGIQYKDHGRRLWSVSTELGAGDIEAHKMTFDWYRGLAVPDDRCLIRIANIDSEDLTAQSTTQALTAATNIQRLMVKATTRNKAPGPNAKFYLSRHAHAAFLDMAVQRMLGNTFTVEALNGRPMLRCMGYEMAICDGIGHADATVS